MTISEFTAMSVARTSFRCSWPGCRPSFPCNNSNGNPKPRKETRVFGQSGVIPCQNYDFNAGRGAGLMVSASNRNGQPESSDLNEDKLSQEDLNYLLKLGAGSVAGAALIKYGSIAFPEITKPNLIEALILISAPVVVTVLLLIEQSKRE